MIETTLGSFRLPNLTHLGFRMIRICNLVADNDGVFHFRFISGAIIKGQPVERPRNRVLRGWDRCESGNGRGDTVCAETFIRHDDDLERL